MHYLIHLALMLFLAAPSYGATYHIDPRDAPYGAACNASSAERTDDTVALQAALNAAAAQRLAFFWPPTGGCYSGTALTDPGVPKMFGLGPTVSGLVYGTGTQDGLVLTSTVPFRYSDFFVRSSVQTPSAGAAILVDTGSPTAVNDGGVMDGLYIDYAYDGIVFNRAAGWTLSKSIIGLPSINGQPDNASAWSSGFIVNRGVTVRNLVLGDYGDSTITANKIAGMFGSHANIYQESSGGLRIVNNKLIGRPRNGYEYNVVPGYGVGVMVVVGNSIEGARHNGIYIHQQAPGGQALYGATIANNQIAGTGDSDVGYVGIKSETVDNMAWIKMPTVTGNSIGVMGLHSGGGIVMNGLFYASITGNSIAALSRYPLPGYGMLISAQHQNGVCQNNSIYGFENLGVVTPSAWGTMRHNAALPCQ